MDIWLVVNLYFAVLIFVSYRFLCYFLFLYDCYFPMKSIRIQMPLIDFIHGFYYFGMMYKNRWFHWFWLFVHLLDLTRENDTANP